MLTINPPCARANATINFTFFSYDVTDHGDNNDDAALTAIPVGKINLAFVTGVSQGRSYAGENP